MMVLGPPNSPPTEGLRRSIKIPMAIKASIQKTVTEKPKLEKNIDIEPYESKTSRVDDVVVIYCSGSETGFFV